MPRSNVRRAYRQRRSQQRRAVILSLKQARWEKATNKDLTHLLTFNFLLEEADYSKDIIGGTLRSFKFANKSFGRRYKLEENLAQKLSVMNERGIVKFLRKGVILFCKYKLSELKYSAEEAVARELVYFSLPEVLKEIEKYKATLLKVEKVAINVIKFGLPMSKNLLRTIRLFYANYSEQENIVLSMLGKRRRF